MCTIFQIDEDSREEEENNIHTRKLKQLLLFGSFISIPPHHQQYVDKYLHDIEN